MTKSLCEIKINQICKIVKIKEGMHLKRRLFELGLLPNEQIKVLSISPLKNTYLIAIKNYTLALRRDVLKNVLVESYE